MKKSEPIQVQRLSFGPNLDAALAIRQRVFVQEQGIPAELDRDGHDRRAHHVLVRAGGVAAATGRVVLTGGETAVAARVAVLPDYRSQGLGRLVVAELEELAEAAGARRILLRPHDYLEGFYRRLGYETVAGVEHVAGHRLITMSKNLGR